MGSLLVPTLGRACALAIGVIGLQRSAIQRGEAQNPDLDRLATFAGMLLTDLRRCRAAVAEASPLGNAARPFPVAAPVLEGEQRPALTPSNDDQIPDPPLTA